MLTTLPKRRRFLADNKMIESFEIENFRCFEKVSLSRLSRINIIVGNNASGKTALIEALRTAIAGIPLVFIMLNNFRGLHFLLPQPPEQRHFDSLWLHYFKEQEITQPIKLSIVNSEGEKASVRIFYDVRPATSATTTSTAAVSNVMSIAGAGSQIIFPIPAISPTVPITPIAFERTHFNGAKDTLYIFVNQQGQVIAMPGPELGPSTVFFPFISAYSEQETISRYSQAIEEKGGKKRVLDLLHRIYPIIEDIESITKIEIAPQKLYVSLPGHSKLQALTLVSSGIYKFFSIMLGIMSAKNGVVLIDEIENGIFHSCHQEIWRLILELSKENNCQIFATTHSNECLVALATASQDNPDDISLIRNEMSEGTANIKHLRGASTLTAIKKVEVR
ncbi:MAG TPA: AAA family ATPase [Burkholderiales bacterium]|nr:AAA family ATPase [Burkholderiales bacterium]